MLLTTGMSSGRAPWFKIPNVVVARPVSTKMQAVNVFLVEKAQTMQAAMILKVIKSMKKKYFFKLN